MLRGEKGHFKLPECATGLLDSEQETVGSLQIGGGVV